MSAEPRTNDYAFGAPRSADSYQPQPGMPEQPTGGFAGIGGFASGPSGYAGYAPSYQDNGYPGTCPPPSGPTPSAFGPPGFGSTPPSGPAPVPPYRPEFPPPTGGFANPTGFGAPDGDYRFSGVGRFDTARSAEATGETNIFAILSLVFAFVVPLAGLVLGIIAKKQITESGEHGDGMALAGIIVGALLTLSMIVTAALMIIAYSNTVGALSSIPAAPTS
jgi:hypothetical protein